VDFVTSEYECELASPGGMQDRGKCNSQSRQAPGWWGLSRRRKPGTIFARADHDVVFSYGHSEAKLKRWSRSPWRSRSSLTRKRGPEIAYRIERFGRWTSKTRPPAPSETKPAIFPASQNHPK